MYQEDYMTIVDLAFRLHEESGKEWICIGVGYDIDRVDYAQYIENGYYVGSGAIESGNKVVLQKRMKLAGMRWNEITAQYLLSLRAKFESNLWNESVVNKILNYSFTVS